MIECKLCGTECKSIRSLSKHLRDHHVGYSLRVYYDEFIAETPAMCVVCGSSDVGFIGLTQGYNKTCGHKCGCTHHRAKLKNDPERHDEFVKKLSKLQTKVWADREVTGEKKIIFEKVSDTLTKSVAEMSPEERKKKFGWLNNLSQEEKEKWISEVMVNTGSHLWARTATLQEKIDMWSKRNATKLGISVDEYLEKIKNITDKESYRDICRTLTDRTYTEYKDQIDPLRLRSDEWHLDHKFSIMQGFLNGVDPEIIASPHNLEIVSRTENCSKHSNCSITLEQLMEMCNG